MLLTGTFSRTLDDKKRLALPKRIREQLENPEAVFVTPGPDVAHRSRRPATPALHPRALLAALPLSKP